MPRQLDDRLLEFGAAVIRFVERLPRTPTGRRIGDQLLRSGTSVGANYEEAQAAESRADFVHKLQVALKELRETRYWLLLLDRAQVVASEHLAPLIGEATELRSILSKSVATAKKASGHG